MRTALFVLAVAAVAYSVPSCGQTPIKPDLAIPEARIVGGTVAVPYSWPWQVVLCSTGWSGGCSLECGGTVIDNGWVMTAGHCVYDDMTPGNYLAKAAIYRVDEDTAPESGEQVSNFKAIHLHPKYNPYPAPSQDIALIELTTPFKFNDHLQPICLPKDDSAAIKPGNLAWCTGWGTTSEARHRHKKLRQVDLPFVDFKLCESEVPYPVVEEIMICAGRKGQDSCQGDSGGPLVTQGPSGTWYQVGIVSFGEGCGEDKEPGIYSRVQAYCSDFIEPTTKGAVKCQDIV